MNWARMAFDAVRPLLRVLEPERAHGLTLGALKTGLLPSLKVKQRPGLSLKLFGLNFPNPLGLAAGFDKNAEVTQAALALGFGFVETGTVTPKPQLGNQKPRLFRLAEDMAVINRMGFNNEGHDAVAKRLEQLGKKRGIIGVNIGANKDAASEVGKLIAERALAAGVKAVVFDRGGYQYHGRVAALAAAAREGGLSF